MERRRFLQLGIASAAVLGVAGGALALLRPGLVEGRLSAAGRDVMRAVSRAVLDGSLPAEAAAQAKAIGAQMLRLDATVATFVVPTQDELSQLLAVLASAPGRIGLAGLTPDWPDASVAQLQQALQSMRVSSLALRMQAYHGLRDLCNAAWYADASAWVQLGYPGPRAL